MLEHGLSYLRSATEFLLLGAIPWWFYVVLSITVAIIIIVELPTRLGLLIGLLAALILGDVGFTSKGYHLGQDHERAWWQANADAEKKRLEEGFQRQLDLETARNAALAADNDKLRGDRLDAINSYRLPAAPPGAVAPIVIPPGTASKLYDIGHGAAKAGGSSGHRPASDSKRAKRILRLFHPRNPDADAE